MVADGHTNNFQGLTSFLNIRFFQWFFFQKIQQILLIRESDWSKNRLRVKKMSKSIKNDTKAGKFLAHLYPKKAQIEQNIIIVFNEN